jgi:hypothetical protein
LAYQGISRLQAICVLEKYTYGKALSQDSERKVGGEVDYGGW